jgi:hypothetical protein
MNTTPDFDEIGRTVPLESWWHLRVVAALRLCFVVVAMYVCLLQFLRIGIWSAMADRTILLLGLWVGLGIYADSIEIVWRKLGVPGRLAAFVVGLVLLTGSIMAPGNLIWSGGAMVGIMFLLGAMAYGLIQILRGPVRALRFRQMKKYLRTLPTEKRRIMRQRLEMNFQTFIAEGFH